MYPEQESLDKVTGSLPAIRHALILLLSDQSYERLSSLAGKNEIRTEIMDAIDGIIHLGEDSGPGEAYFTNFVMQ